MRNLKKTIVTAMAIAFTGILTAKAAEELKTDMKEKLYLNVKDFGAIGDGKTDNSDALQRAFDAACMENGKVKRNACRKVILPPGIYNVNKSIKLITPHWNLVIEGTGGACGSETPNLNGVQPANTIIRWNGAEGGVMFDVYGVVGLQMRDLLLDGQGKCGTLVKMDSLDSDNKSPALWKKYGGRASALWFIERMAFRNAEVGFQCGKDSWTCASDLTMIDSDFHKCGVGFMTMKGQNVNYNFIRCGVSLCDIGLYFNGGGSVTASLLSGYSCGYAIKIDGVVGINNGNYNFIGTKIETRIYKGKRTAILYAEAACNVKFSSICTSCMGLSKVSKKSVEYGTQPDRKTPMFVLRKGAMVKIDSSLISGSIADIKEKSWLQFDNCRFRFLADPEKDITCDKSSGFEVRNSFVTRDKLEKKYIIDKQVFIERLRKLPEMEIINREIGEK